MGCMQSYMLRRKHFEARVSKTKRTFYRITEADIVTDRDIVVMLFTGTDDVAARLRTPEWDWSEPMMPRVAFISAFEHLNGATYNAEVVIIDAESVWRPVWGELVDHPRRPA